MDTKQESRPRVRRRHDEALKRRVLEACTASRASVAEVAMAHGLNANLVHKWRQQARAGEQRAATFVPVAVTAAQLVSETAQFVDVELQRGAVSVRVRWPMSAAASCAAWLREILR